jgi:hypothetical protein
MMPAPPMFNGACGHSRRQTRVSNLTAAGRTKRLANIIMVCATVLGTVGMRDGNIYFSRDVKRRAAPILKRAERKESA